MHMYVIRNDNEHVHICIGANDDDRSLVGSIIGARLSILASMSNIDQQAVNE